MREDIYLRQFLKRSFGIAMMAAVFLFLFPTAQALAAKQNMTYIYFGDSSKYSQLVDSTQNSLDEVAPAYFSLDDSGGLVLTPAVSSTFVSRMHDEGISVVPYISNDWVRAKGQAALAGREALAKELAQAVADYNLDGVNIDIENMTPAERASYVDFVRLLRELLPEGKTIAVAVAANPSGTTSDWAGSYDYAGLARYCDYLMIMAYDESYEGSEPGPVASLAFVENSIRYALRVVPKEQIVLGLPFYGRIWASYGGSPRGYGISNSKIEALIEDYNGTVEFDASRGSAHATITVGPDEEKPVIAGKDLAAGTYDIWFQDECSLKAELALVTKYDLRGTGSWSLGQEAAGTWDYYKLWLCGCAFDDVQTSWAKEFILTSYENGWMNGMSADSFSPDSSLTRAQAAAVLVRMLGLPVQVDSANRFSDCGGHWAAAYIDTARKYGIVSGVGDNLFDPERPVTREEIAVMLQNILGETGGGALSSFPDVAEDTHPWSYDAIEALGSLGIITGYPDGSFRPTNPVTRAEFAALAARMSPALPEAVIAN
jgi:spore germination protein YaaH